MAKEVAVDCQGEHSSGGAVVVRGGVSATHWDGTWVFLGHFRNRFPGHDVHMVFLKSATDLDRISEKKNDVLG